MSDSNPRTLWFPIASSGDLPYRHVLHAQLLGRELAVWRADDGHVNVWENRCLHRGVRLSIAINEGSELKCQYHGWRYANRSAACTYIPAHPADAPARSIANRSFAAVERDGLVWSGEDPRGEPPVLGMEAGAEAFALRPIPVNAGAGLVVAALAQHYAFQPSDAIAGTAATTSARALGGFLVEAAAREGDALTRAVLLVQPVDAARSVIRGVLRASPAEEQRLAVLRHHNQRLSALRDRIEAEALLQPQPEPMHVELQPVPADLAPLPEPRAALGRTAALRVRIERKWAAAEDVAAFRLAPIAGELPSFQPGAHIDVHLPNGLIRQYSLTNGPQETDAFVIGVKREEASRGGSHCMHDALREGDVLAISEPRNNFPLRRDAVRTLLVAGGIGLTPLLSMARTLRLGSLPFELHGFARSAAHVPFADALAALGPAVRPHLGLDAAATGAALGEILAGWQPGTHLYVCGPAPMLDAARATAARLGWPETAVHFEYFGNTTPRDQSSAFEVALARSCLTLAVPAGRSIVEVLRANGVAIPTSCEQGACGTCLTQVLEGEPEHQDVYLSEAEKRRGASMLPCVSRARSPRLVLDI